MPLRLAIRFDLRSPDGLGASPSTMYPAAIEQIEMADRAGFDVLYLAEHHIAEDGYLPAPIAVAAAAASRTKRIRLHFSALIAVLHHPVRLAEELAVVDLLSGGRVEMTLGIGYRAIEFDLFDVNRRTRVALYDEILDTMAKAWTGEPFEYRGQTITVRPRPVQQPGPPMFVGGNTEASALRAARTPFGFLPATPQLFDVFAEERRRLGGVVPQRPRAKGPLFLHVSDDPERDWPIVAPHLMYASNMTAAWARERGVGATPYPEITTVEQLRAMPQFRVVTPGECVEVIRNAGPDAEITLHPMMGGLGPEHGTASVERFTTKVLPALTDAGLWTPPGPDTPVQR